MPARPTEPAAALECSFCAQHCRLTEGQTGLCGVRRHEAGQIRSLYYGQVAALALDPVEKKPLYHVMPGSATFSVALPGCNFHCEFCQNHHLAQIRSTALPPTRYLGPADLLQAWQDSGSPSLSFTYSEPTVWADWVLDCAGPVRAAGGRIFMVSNGYLSAATRSRLEGLVTAWNIDLKGDDHFYRRLCGGRYAPVLDNIAALVQAGKTGPAGRSGLVEVTTLLLEDWHSPAVLDQLGRDLFRAGVEIWHLSRFFPACRMQDHRPTSEVFLQAALERARDSGIPYVYGGNTSRHQDTRCPACQAVLIRRDGAGRGRLAGISLAPAAGPACAACGHPVPLIP